MLYYNINFILILKIFTKAGAKLMEQQRPQDAIEIFSKAIDCFYDFAMPPHRETHIAQESLRSCYATFGNTHILKEK